MSDRLIKVCGITRLVDALHALQRGATALGFVFWPASPRAIATEQAREIIAALPDGARTVGVFVNETAAREIAAKQGIGIVVSGTVRRDGAAYDISVTAKEAVSGKEIATAEDRAT